MLLGELFLALTLAIIFTLIFSLGLKRSGPWSLWWTFFLTIFLVALASAIWISHRGPVFSGVYWLPVIFTTFIFAVIIAAGTPVRSDQPKVETISQVKQHEKAADKMINFLLYLFLGTLIAVIIIGYITR